METKYGTWYGKPLEEYNKEELIEIIVRVSEYSRKKDEEHARDLDFLASNK